MFAVLNTIKYSRCEISLMVPSANSEMKIEIRPCASAEEVKQAIAPIGHYFGRSAPNADHAERMTRVLPAGRVYAAWEGDRAVGALGAFPFQLTVPGGRVSAAGVTVAGFLPTHRRRGILRAPAQCRLLADRFCRRRAHRRSPRSALRHQRPWLCIPGWIY